MSTTLNTTTAGAEGESGVGLSSILLLDTVAQAEASILLVVIALCILIVSIAIIWISCRLCASDYSTRSQEKQPTSTAGVYQWNSMTSQRE